MKIHIVLREERKGTTSIEGAFVLAADAVSMIGREFPSCELLDENGRLFGDEETMLEIVEIDLNDGKI